MSRHSTYLVPVLWCVLHNKSLLKQKRLLCLLCRQQHQCFKYFALVCLPKVILYIKQHYLKTGKLKKIHKAKFHRWAQQRTWTYWQQKNNWETHELTKRIARRGNAFLRELKVPFFMIWNDSHCVSLKVISKMPTLLLTTVRVSHRSHL